LDVANFSRLPGQSSFFQAIECRQKQGLMHRTAHTASASRPCPPGARCGAISNRLDNAARADLKRRAQRIAMRPLPPMYLLRETLQRLNQQHITALLGDPSRRITERHGFCQRIDEREAEHRNENERDAAQRYGCSPDSGNGRHRYSGEACEAHVSMVSRRMKKGGVTPRISLAFRCFSG
jgi:hypothetical protein